MTKIILFITLLSFSAHAAENAKELDVKNLTEQKISAKASSLMRFSKYQRTIDFCNKVLKYKPYSPEAHFRKGKALSELKKWKEAIASYDLAM